MDKKHLKILELDSTCTGCGACVSVCSKGALKLEYNDEGFYYPKHDISRCVNCRLCEKVCHVLNAPVSGDYISREYEPYMVKAKNPEVVRKSSSGGMFSILAEDILNKDGIVYGARYNFEKERLEHTSTDKYPLDELRKSKYIESYLGDTFLDVRKQLRNNREVLFCGTPCQVKGLVTFLNATRTDMANLVTVRFICHGVPANLFFAEYKQWKERKVGAQMTSFDFRPKTRGWRESNLLMTFANGRKCDELYRENYYYGYYYSQKNYLLRKCCYACNQLSAVTGDFTIGDFWGDMSMMTESVGAEGISLVLVQSEKAKRVFAEISDKYDALLLPQMSVDYIYKDSVRKKGLFPLRAKMMRDVIRGGYMQHVRKRLIVAVVTAKIKRYVKTILKATGIWKLIKK